MSDGGTPPAAADRLIALVRDHYATTGPVPLHAPVFAGNEQAYVAETIRSTFVSSVGSFVDRFEADMAAYTGAGRAVAVVNGTAALHVALVLAGVMPGDLVLTQALTFVATCNAIRYAGADPVFCDVDRETLGLSPEAVDAWLTDNATIGEDGLPRAKGRVLRACLPMHSFGHPVRLAELMEVCARWNLTLVEDAAESLGSTYRGRHTGTFGRLGSQSFNGNKILTTGGGGMILTDAATGARAKHLTTTAKVPHPTNTSMMRRAGTTACPTSTPPSAWRSWSNWKASSPKSGPSPPATSPNSRPISTWCGNRPAAGRTTG